MTQGMSGDTSDRLYTPEELAAAEKGEGPVTLHFADGWSFLDTAPPEGYDIVVVDLPDDHEAASICGSIIGLAHSLELQTVAEGVETEAQLAQLRAEGCDEVQGYLFSRPLFAAEMAAWLAAGAAGGRARSAA